MPCYATRRPMLQPAEAHHDCHSRPVATGREDANTTKERELAFVLVTGFTSNTGAMATIVVPGLADENECHKLALKLNTPKHGCLSIELPRRMPMWPMPFKMSCRTAASLGDASRRELGPHGVYASGIADA